LEDNKVDKAEIDALKKDLSEVKGAWKALISKTYYFFFRMGCLFLIILLILMFFMTSCTTTEKLTQPNINDAVILGYTKNKKRYVLSNGFKPRIETDTMKVGTFAICNDEFRYRF
jgi:hypothetical protein